MFPHARKILSLFILFYLAAIFVWTLPSGPLRNHLVRYVEPTLLATGLWQNWEMFSPSPQIINFHLDADVIFKDGHHKVWTFPRMEEMGILRRYQKERYRKWRERIRQDNYASVWPDTGRFIARLNYDPSNPPVQVLLWRHWADIPPPKEASYQPIPSHYVHGNHFNFFTYNIVSGDLP